MHKAMMAGLLGLTVLLGGCLGKEPSESDISKAVKTSIDQANEETENLSASMAVRFVSARKISCAPSSERNLYKCHAEIETVAPLVGRKKRVVPVQLINDHGTWEVDG